MEVGSFQGKFVLCIVAWQCSSQFYYRFTCDARKNCLEGWFVYMDQHPVRLEDTVTVTCSKKQEIKMKCLVSCAQCTDSFERYGSLLASTSQPKEIRGWDKLGRDS